MRVTLNKSFRDIFNKVGYIVLLKLYGLIQGKPQQQLFYDELLRQIKDTPKINALFPEEKIAAYGAFQPVRNTLTHPDLYLTQIRYYYMYNFFKKHHPDIFKPETSILNIGDPSGILLEALGKRGTSLNIKPECVHFILNKGIDAVLANAENIEFADSSFDYVFSFQCLAHIPNPIKALNEFGRLARRKVFLSIPYTARTIIYNKNTWVKLLNQAWKIESPRQFDCNIFEFSTEDFKNILSYTNLEYEDSFPIHYFDNNNLLRRILNRYKKSHFNFFILKPRQ